MMKIKLCSVFVENQQKALEFYTSVLGFVKKADFPVGEFRWLTVVSPESPADIELLLEPNANIAAATYQTSIYDQGIAATAFFVDDIDKEYQRMIKHDVVFRTKPTKVEGEPTMALFDDTCGNLIQLVEE
jgi:predicted enzyme related to lactoylglutathione lyase